MAQQPAAEPAAAGTSAHPVVDEGTGPEAEVGSPEESSAHPETGGAGERGDDERSATDRLRGGPEADVTATGTALHRGERRSGLDLDDAPGAAGPGAG